MGMGRGVNAAQTELRFQLTPERFGQLGMVIVQQRHHSLHRAPFHIIRWVRDIPGEFGQHGLCRVGKAAATADVSASPKVRISSASTAMIVIASSGGNAMPICRPHASAPWNEEIVRRTSMQRCAQVIRRQPMDLTGRQAVGCLDRVHQDQPVWPAITSSSRSPPTLASWKSTLPASGDTCPPGGHLPRDVDTDAVVGEDGVAEAKDERFNYFFTRSLVGVCINCGSGVPGPHSGVWQVTSTKTHFCWQLGHSRAAGARPGRYSRTPSISTRAGGWVPAGMRTS